MRHERSTPDREHITSLGNESNHVDSSASRISRNLREPKTAGDVMQDHSLEEAASVTSAQRLLGKLRIEGADRAGREREIISLEVHTQAQRQRATEVEQRFQ